MVHGDILPEELSDFAGWGEDVWEAMAEEGERASEFSEPWWDEEAESPPSLSEEELRAVDPFPTEAGSCCARGAGRLRW